MAVERKLMTAEEFALLPDDDTFQELVRGEVITSPPPGGPHGETAAEITALIRAHVRMNRAGRVFTQSGFRIARNPDTVRAPDVAFFTMDRMPASIQGYPDMVPDLVVEVVSPSDRAGAVQKKTQEWLHYGARLVWVVYPGTRSIEVHEPGEPIRLLGPDDTIDGGNVLPGFHCLVREFFPE